MRNKTITMDEAKSEFAQFMQAYGAPFTADDLRRWMGVGGYMNIVFGNDRIAWATDATVAINTHTEEITVDINWSGTGRNTTTARVAIRNYTAACEFAEAVEAFTQSLNIETFADRYEREKAAKEEAVAAS